MSPGEPERRGVPDPSPADPAAGSRRGRAAPGPPGLPLVGHLPAFLRDKLGFLSRCAAVYGDVVRLELGVPTYLVSNPEDVRHVLVTNADNYDKTPRVVSRRGRRLFGNGLVTLSGAIHARHRRMLHPVFSRTATEGFADLMAAGTARMLDRWQDGVELDIGRELMALVQEVIFKTLFGPDFEDARFTAAVDTRRRYLEHVFFTLLPFPEYWPTRINREYRLASRVIDEVVRREIRARRGGPSRRPDMLSLLLAARYEDGSGMTDGEIRDEVRNLTIAGYETLGEALTWTFFLLARHPAAESRLLTELHDTLGGRAPTVEDLPRLSYARMVLAESMRLFPPSWILVRIARAPDLLPSGFGIPAGAKLYLSQFVMHRSPRHFPDPERFDPERFGRAAEQERPRFAYFPFGGGRRQCLGEGFAWMEGLIVLAGVVQRFALTLVPGQTVVPDPNMTLRPRHGIRMHVGERGRSRSHRL